MKNFKFQQFEIIQNKSVFCVGTDAVLLGALCDISIATNVLEVGTGTGIISLMLAQRFPKIKILGIDIEKEATELTRENFKNSVFYERLRAFQTDYMLLEESNKYDAIVCNPPYFLPNESKKNKIARQMIYFKMVDFFLKSQKIISETGSIQIIIPSQDSQKTEDIATEFGFHLIRKIDIYGIRNGKLIRNILKFALLEKPFSKKSFVIEDSPRKYSRDYLDATKEFHAF